jgi:predicted transposase YdaD
MEREEGKGKKGREGKEGREEGRKEGRKEGREEEDDLAPPPKKIPGSATGLGVEQTTGGSNPNPPAIQTLTLNSTQQAPFGQIAFRLEHH